MMAWNRVGDITPPCGTPCLRVLFLRRCCFIWTFAFLLCIYCPIHLNIRPATPRWCSFNLNPSLHTLSNAFSRSIHTASVCFLSLKASSIAWAIKVIWFSVDRSCCLLWCDVLFIFKVPHESCVDEAFHQFSHATGKANWSVAFSL